MPQRRAGLVGHDTARLAFVPDATDALGRGDPSLKFDAVFSIDKDRYFNAAMISDPREAMGPIDKPDVAGGRKERVAADFRHFDRIAGHHHLADLRIPTFVATFAASSDVHRTAASQCVEHLDVGSENLFVRTDKTIPGQVTSRSMSPIRSFVGGGGRGSRADIDGSNSGRMKEIFSHPTPLRLPFDLLSLIAVPSGGNSLAWGTVTDFLHPLPF
jgi:hypothetical protein